MRFWRESPGRLRNPEEKLVDFIFDSIIPSTSSRELISFSPFSSPRINKAVESASASATVLAITVADMVLPEGHPFFELRI